MKTTQSPLTVKYVGGSFPEINIPTGTPVAPAHNQPLDKNGNQKYWVKDVLALQGGEAYAETGILLTKEEVEGTAE